MFKNALNPSVSSRTLTCSSARCNQQKKEINVSLYLLGVYKGQSHLISSHKVGSSCKWPQKGPNSEMELWKVIHFVDNDVHKHAEKHGHLTVAGIPDLSLDRRFKKVDISYMFVIPRLLCAITRAQMSSRIFICSQIRKILLFDLKKRDILGRNFILLFF